MSTLLKTFLLSILFTFSLAACDNNDGPAEKFGESVDEAGEDIGDAAEDAADNMEDAVED